MLTTNPSESKAKFTEKDIEIMMKLHVKGYVLQFDTNNSSMSIQEPFRSTVNGRLNFNEVYFGCHMTPGAMEGVASNLLPE